MSRAKSASIKLLLTMGANFGDLDNDGWLDFYLGTGDPRLTSLGSESDVSQRPTASVSRM